MSTRIIRDVISTYWNRLPIYGVLNTAHSRATGTTVACGLLQQKIIKTCAALPGIYGTIPAEDDSRVISNLLLPAPCILRALNPVDIVESWPSV